eukprot:SM014099S00569  [mRNA]  locus=s14099:2:257:- [translate_table: standard]
MPPKRRPEYWAPGMLVLGKVKGYPPWPARVSDPEAHGHKPNRLR